MELGTRRQGFALPAALLALVIIGAMVTGGVYVAMEHDRTTANAYHGDEAFMAAERGLEDVLGIKTRLYFQDTMGVSGEMDVLGPVPLSINNVQAQYTVYVRRVSDRLFNVESVGEVVSGGRYAGSKRRLAETMRISYTLFPMDRAVTTHVGMRMVGKAGVSGTDTVPGSWADCTVEGDKTGVVSKVDVSEIEIHGSAGVTGDPPKQQDATLDSLDFVQFGDMELKDLMAVADIRLSPGTYTGMGPVSSGGVCDKSVLLNWGDPYNTTGACHLYWPIIYSDGDLHLSSGIGQGILIVTGDLELTGSFEFSGLVFVYGAFVTAGQGNKVMGSLSVLGNSSTTSEVGKPNASGVGITNIQLSTCAIERANSYNERFARPIPLKERKFVDVSGLGVN